LLWKWLKNDSDVENNAYKTLIFAYNKELELLVLASCITKSDVEEENSPPYPKDAMTDLEKEMMNLENTTMAATPLVGCLVCNGFQQTKQPTNGTQLYLICLEQSLPTPLKLATIAKPSRRKVLKNYV